MSSMELWVKSVSLPISWSRFRGLGGGGVEREEEVKRSQKERKGTEEFGRGKEGKRKWDY